MKWVKASERLPERTANPKPIMIKFPVEGGTQERMITVNVFLNMVNPFLEKIEWLDRDHQEHEYFDCLERFDPIIFRRTVFADEKIEAIKTLLLNESISPETFRDEVGKILNS